jgi:short chain dehydrogenase
MSKIWLVTGSASGLGREIAEAVLASGDRLLATARDPQRLNDLVERYGEQVSTASLDVSDEAAAHRRPVPSPRIETCGVHVSDSHWHRRQSVGKSCFIANRPPVVQEYLKGTPH